MPATFPSRAAACVSVLMLLPLAAPAETLWEPSDESPYGIDLGGRLMWDFDSFDGVLNADNDGDRRFQGQLRRARIELSGDLPQNFDWVFDVNILENGDAEVHEAGLRYTGWDFADVFVGRTKEPIGLEELTSSKALSTIRRNLLTEATDADNQPNYGVRLDGFVGPIGWQAGVFNPNGNPKNKDGGDRLAYTGRLFTAPIEDGDHVLHFGLAYTDRGLDQAEELSGFALRVAESGERLASTLLLTREDRQLDFEVLYLRGPFSLQGEKFWRDLKGAEDRPDARIDSHYLMGTWTLTGESRGYKIPSGVPDMVSPSGPRGAVELVARYEYIGLDRAAMTDQKARIYLAGINWYPNDYVKLMLNVAQVETDDLVPAGETDDGLAISTRIQVAF